MASNKKPSAQQEELLDAVRNGDEVAASTILALGVPPNFCSTATSPLIAAAETGNFEILKHLLAAGADVNMLAGINSPLRAAITGGDGECILALLEGGANVNQETPRGTPLTTAATQGDCSTISLLLDHGAEADFELRGGVTALIAAVQADQREAVRLLLQRGADPDRRSVDGERTALDVAETLTLPEVCSLLMQRSVSAAAEKALVDSDRRQEEAKKQMEESSAKMRDEMEAEKVVAREDVTQKTSAINAESEELMARLGLTRPAGRGRLVPKAAAAEASQP